MIGVLVIIGIVVCKIKICFINGDIEWFGKISRVIKYGVNKKCFSKIF